MAEYAMTCSCGEELKVEADSREEGVLKFKRMLNAEGIEAHMSEKHSGESVPSVREIHAQIERVLEQVEMA